MFLDSFNKFNAYFVRREKYLILILKPQIQESTSKDQDPFSQIHLPSTISMSLVRLNQRGFVHGWKILDCFGVLIFLI